jgi:hypothetical protein
MNLWQDGPWGGLLLYFLTSVFVVPSFAVGAAIAVHVIWKGVVHYFLDAWKDFTVEIELGGVPIETPSESV